MDHYYTGEEAYQGASQNQTRQRIVELVNKATVRFEPRSLVDLAGQTAASKWRELNRLPIQVKRCLFSKIYTKHVAWIRDSLDQQLLIKVSNTLRKILVKSNKRTLPLNFDRVKLQEARQILKAVKYIISNFDQYAHRCRYEEICTTEYGVVRYYHICLEPVPTQDLSFAIEQTQRLLPEVKSLIKQWMEHWEMIKSHRFNEVGEFLLNLEINVA